MQKRESRQRRMMALAEGDAHFYKLFRLPASQIRLGEVVEDADDDKRKEKAQAGWKLYLRLYSLVQQPQASSHSLEKQLNDS